MRNLIIRSVSEWSTMDTNAMKLCNNLVIKNIIFQRRLITLEHYFPNAENLFIDNSGPIPWLINQLVNDGRTPSLRNLYITDDVKNYFVSSSVKTFHLGDGNNNSSKMISVRDRETLLTMFVTNLH